MLQNNTSMREIGADLARSRETLETFTGDAKLLSIFFVSWLVLVFILIFFDFLYFADIFYERGQVTIFFFKWTKEKRLRL